MLFAAIIGLVYVLQVAGNTTGMVVIVDEHVLQAGCICPKKAT